MTALMERSVFWASAAVSQEKFSKITNVVRIYLIYCVFGFKTTLLTVQGMEKKSENSADLEQSIVHCFKIFA